MVSSFNPDTPAIPSFSLYVHVPFCLRRCPYCDFFTLPYDEELEKRLLKFVPRQIENYCERFQVLGRRVDTLYFGGGSPSCVGEGFLEKMLILLNDRFDLSDLKEVTIEANPSDVSVAKVKAWRRLGITRVSLGIQSFCDDVLLTLGRVHRRRDNCSALGMLLNWFERVSVDLIFAVPGQKVEDWRADLEFLLRYFPEVEHVSIYNLTIEENTEFYRRYRDLDLSDISRQMYELGDEVIQGFGFEWYEISNFSRPGRECIHNVGYWLGSEYIGLGPSGWSFVNGVRFKMDWNGEVEEDRLSTKKARRERAVLSLRTRWGVRKDDLDPDQVEYLSSMAKEMGWVVEEDDRFVLTLLGRLFADAIASSVI